MLRRQTVETTTVYDGYEPAECERIISDRAVGVVFQPIVRTDTGDVVGYEALARGPAGSPLASPSALFGEAYRMGRQDELDWICRAAAVREAMAAGLPDTTPLFVNAEPSSLGSACPPDLLSVIAAGRSRLRIVLEVTERRIAADPAGLLAAADDARAMSMGLALDDVGADSRTLAMMPMLRPDVIKLDLSLIQGRTTMAIAGTVNAVLAQAEHTGAAILAEGVETQRHVEVAQSLGATLGQGWHYGRPGPLRPRPRRGRSAINLLGSPHPGPGPGLGIGPGPGIGIGIGLAVGGAPGARTPFEAIAGRRTSRATERLLLPMSMHLEYQGLDMTAPALLLVCLPENRHFGPAARHRYGRLAARGVFTAVLGAGVSSRPEPDIRGGHVHADDPLAREWSVVVLGAHFAGALIARECDGLPQHPRRFDFVVTHDRDLVIAAARPLLDRLLPV